VAEVEQQPRRSADPALDGAARPLGQPSDLQGQLVLVRPEPGHVAIGLLGAQHVACGERTLRIGVPPTFKAQQPGGHRVRESADVARGKDVGIFRHEPPIDHDAAVDRETRRLGEGGARHRADADQRRIGLDRIALLQGQRDAVARRRDAAQPGTEPDLDPGRGVARLEQGGERRRHRPAQQARRELDHDRSAAEEGGAGGDPRDR